MHPGLILVSAFCKMYMIPENAIAWACHLNNITKNKTKSCLLNFSNFWFFCGLIKHLQNVHESHRFIFLHLFIWLWKWQFWWPAGLASPWWDFWEDTLCEIDPPQEAVSANGTSWWGAFCFPHVECMARWQPRAGESTEVWSQQGNLLLLGPLLMAAFYLSNIGSH